jgi:hypothetical protein
MLGLLQSALIGGAAVLLLVLLLRLWGRRPRSGERLVDPTGAHQLLTARQAAEQLGLSENDVLGRALRGELPCYVVVGENRTKPGAYRFSAEELEAVRVQSRG